MFDEPAEEPNERAFKPEDRAKDKFDEFRMHAELVAVFEGKRKFDAQLDTKFDGSIARDIQKAVAKLEREREPDTPLVKPALYDEAAAILDMPTSKNLSTNDYHIHRRPGEVMIVRWLAGEQVESFYARMQAHFEAALNAFRKEERQSLEWKQEPATIKYLDALDAIDVKMADRYLRPIIKQHNAFVVSTQTADEMDILHLCDYVMNVSAAEVVGKASAPPDEQATESERAWFFKLFALRGMKQGIEQMCFFTYLQKTDESFDFDE